MKNHRRYQILATISIGIFIVCFAVCMTAMNRNIYEKCIEQASDRFYIEYVTRGYTTGTIQSEYNKELVALELGLNYDKLMDCFDSFFKKDFEIPKEELVENNQEGLSAIKVYYRWSVVALVLSIVGIVYSMLHLYKGRYYGPFFYGGLLGTLLLVIQVVGLKLSENVIFSAFREMIFNEDYSFFADGDVLRFMLPPEFARWLATGYFVFGFGMALIFIILRAITIYRSKPHKF